MNAKIIKYLLFLIASVISGLLLALSFPAYKTAWLAWFSLVPLLSILPGRNPFYAFCLAFVFGVIFMPLIFQWIFEAPAFTLRHFVISAIYFGLFFGFFGFVVGLISKRWGILISLTMAPFIWVTMEFTKSCGSFLAFPWPFLAHSQYEHPIILQFASFTGAYGVSFLIVLVNAAISALILRFIYLYKGLGSSEIMMPSGRATLLISVVAALLTGFALLYGNVTMANPITGNLIKAGVVQGNIEQSKKWDPKYADVIMKTYLNLSRNVSKNGPEFIIWPEAATPGNIIKNARLWRQMRSLAIQTKAFYLIGSTESPKFQKAAPSTGKRYGNTALFISPEGKLLGQYLKIRLLPFVEYMPCEGLFKWPKLIIPETTRKKLIKGEEYTLFELKGTNFGVSICWENIFPDVIRRFCLKGAELIINITNEAWFGETAAPYQFLSMSVFRAVENRIPIIRVGNTGISCFIDAYGRITGSVQEDGKELFVRGYLTQEIHASKQRTFYTHFGDVFAYGCIFITIVWVVTCLFKKPSAVSKTIDTPLN